ncbi:MAG: NAD(+)/NADH kinase [Verrucomicrobiota bacterium]
MRPRIAIFGGNFNPPGIHHRAVVEALIPHFDKIIVIPCGPRPDKFAINDVDPRHRAALTDITFRGIPKVEVDLFDLELASFTSNDALEARYGALGELWHVIGSDLSKGGARQESAVHLHWNRGEEIWRTLNFCVISRETDPVVSDDLPPMHQLIGLSSKLWGDSSEIRERIFHREPYAAMVVPEVAAYIERYGLYRGRIPSRRTRWQAETPRLLIFADERNAQAMALAQAYRRWEDRENPTSILVLGGDGTMLRAIREHWRKRLPFIGVNQGHLGFLLNEPSTLPAERLPESECIIRFMPMLFIEVTTPDGLRQTDLAFNDAWVERSTSQSAWLEIEVNGQVRIPKLVADGALVCTAAGSTAYARSMGVAPLLADTPGWILAGSNVMTPTGWKSALLAPETSVTLRSIGGEKRPLNAFVGGYPLGPVTSFHARESRIASVELVFAAQRDMAEKISLIQFPSGGASLIEP